MYVSNNPSFSKPSRSNPRSTMSFKVMTSAIAIIIILSGLIASGAAAPRDDAPNPKYSGPGSMDVASESLDVAPNGEDYKSYGEWWRYNNLLLWVGTRIKMFLVFSVVVLCVELLLGHGLKAGTPRVMKGIIGLSFLFFTKQAADKRLKWNLNWWPWTRSVFHIKKKFKMWSLDHKTGISYLALSLSTRWNYKHWSSATSVKTPCYCYSLLRCMSTRGFAANTCRLFVCLA